MFLFLDMCYAASWCVQLAGLKEKLNISIFASSDVKEKSKSLSGRGGLLTMCLLNSDNIEMDIKLLMHYQKPKYINNMQAPANLQPKHIAVLHESITNAKKISEDWPI